MSRYTFSVDVAAPPERVFDLWTDLDRMREWVGGVTRVSDVSGPIDQVGARYTVWFAKMASPTEVIAVERPHHIRTRFGNRLLRGITDARFQPTQGGTRLEETLETEGFVSALFARIFATGTYKGSFRGELEAFARLAERAEPEVR
jgi:uncharacterized protein YndB with AHSA1/START domain